MKDNLCNSFKQVIADFLSTEEVEDIKEMFRKMDTDNDGIVSIEELKSGLRNFGSQLAESEVQILIEAVSMFALFSISSFNHSVTSDVICYAMCMRLNHPFSDHSLRLGCYVTSIRWTYILEFSFRLLDLYRNYRVK